MVRLSQVVGVRGEGIQDISIVPVSRGPLYPLCWSKVATTTK